MRTVNMREAKTHLSRLVRDAENGVPFIIARAGKPVVMVISVDAPDPGTGLLHRIGFLDGQFTDPMILTTWVQRKSRSSSRAGGDLSQN